MPTESTFFFAGLLFLAAGLGYFFARFGDSDEGGPQDVESARFLKGFRYLLNEEPDRAVEAFTGPGEVNDDAIDTQLALGALFRRRGELDRAIRIHQNLVERAGLGASQRDRAIFALAEDYLGAGLFDRAEELLVRLRDSPPYRAEALGKLLRICEVTRDWDRAIDLCGDLRRLDATAVSPVQLANYYCEAAAQAFQDGRQADARELAAMARAADPGSVRARLVSADLDRDTGQTAAALEAYLQLAAAEPQFLSELLPRMVQCGGSAPGGLSPVLEQLVRTCPDCVAPMAMAVVRDPRIVDPAVLAAFREWVGADPILSALVGGNLAGSPGPQDWVPRVRGALNQLARSLAPYQCGACGYQSASLQWQCPGCRSWETIRANNRLLPGAGSS